MTREHNEIDSHDDSQQSLQACMRYTQQLLGDCCPSVVQDLVRNIASMYNPDQALDLDWDPSQGVPDCSDMVLSSHTEETFLEWV
mmetsp:Transcript_13410/g.22002  ORF Transcript_13410/g.22002 Transcript_13410/m.22002 type:complete len:85 (+) Transcript_13410:106-360(+)